MNFEKYLEKKGYTYQPWQVKAIEEFAKFIEQKSIEYAKKNRIFIPLENGTGKSWMFEKLEEYLVDKHNGRV